MQKNMSDAIKVAKIFDFDGEFVSLGSYGSGHINDTYLVSVMRDGEVVPSYILQRINHNVFPNVEGLMDNMIKVTQYLNKNRKASVERNEILTLVPTQDGRYCVRDSVGDYWRATIFVDNSISYDLPDSPELFYQSAVAFGRFAKDLGGFDASALCEVIPDFHNNEARLMQLRNAVEKDAMGRKAEVEKEIRFAFDREEDFSFFNTMLKNGKLPLRVTHNDTKLNNVLFDKTTKKSVCVIDLDTVMPGFLGFDFGDAIRFGANTAAEDEADLSKVEISLEMFEAYAEGFISVCADTITETEAATLSMGAKMMTLECGIRFLADYLNGDTYFKISRPNHNLDRARNHFKLVSSMEAHWSQMESIIQKVYNKYKPLD